MANLLRRAPFTNFASFVEAGTVVGDEENVVSRDFYPDAEGDLGVYSSLGCLLQVSPETVSEDDIRKCPQGDGTYRQTNNPIVIQDLLKISLECTFEILHRITWGLKNKIANNTAQTPFANPDRFVEGWLIFEQRIPGGGTIVSAALYGRIYLDAAPTWSSAPDSPAIRFENHYSPIATIKPNLIVPA